VFCAYRDIWNIDLPSFADVSPADVEDVARMIERHALNPWAEVDPMEQQAGDVALFRQELRLPTHVGLVVRPWVMVHVKRAGFSEMTGFSHADWRGRMWAHRLVAIYRHEDLT
jgi:hypothetical protein